MSDELHWCRVAAAIRETTGIKDSREQMNRFRLYLEHIIAWSRAQRITGFKTPGEMVDNLIVDSLLFLPLLPARPCRVVDIGSGVGVPGLPLRIADPDISLTLIEARRKRASFLKSVVRALGLLDVEVLQGRAEQLAREQPELAGSCDAVVMRMVGRVDDVVPVAAAYLRVGGRCVISAPPPTKTRYPAPHIPGFTVETRRTVLAELGLERTFLVFARTP
jgi:16S rRNA (guanine527-N7)-methyltransferase